MSSGKIEAHITDHVGPQNTVKPNSNRFRRGRFMPTLSKPQMTERDSPWIKTYDEIYLELCQNRGPILGYLGFYDEHSLDYPGADQAITKDEETELRDIASALTIAAAASGAMPTAVLIASLLPVSESPSLFLSRQLPAAVERAIAANYQRDDERPGTHWRDVWGDQRASPGSDVET